MRRPLRQSFYDREPAVVARELLGALLIHNSEDGMTVGRIVETEAYLAENDTACHAYRGMTRRNASMFGPPGMAYVYAIHSRWCLNAVTQPAGTASAVLIRAVEPIEGHELMAQRRGRERELELCRGPGRLCQAFAVDRRFDGSELFGDGPLWIASGSPLSESETGVSTRIGVTSAQDLELRFFHRNCRFVSRGSR